MLPEFRLMCLSVMPVLSSAYLSRRLYGVEQGWDASEIKNLDTWSTLTTPGMR